MNTLLCRIVARKIERHMRTDIFLLRVGKTNVGVLDADHLVTELDIAHRLFPSDPVKIDGIDYRNAEDAFNKLTGQE